MNIPSYLENRHHSVEVENKHSTLLPVYSWSGVPQGSILGPYINDLPEIILTSKVFLFADDTKLLKTISSPQKKQFQSDPNEVTNCMVQKMEPKYEETSSTGGDQQIDTTCI